MKEEHTSGRHWGMDVVEDEPSQNPAVLSGLQAIPSQDSWKMWFIYGVYVQLCLLMMLM